ncbi:MAG: peroxiredoxin family protein, partial [Gammaproteobacteria bacterium]
MRIAGLLACSMLLTTPARAQTDDARTDMPGPTIGQTFPHALAAADQDGVLQSLDSLYGSNGAAVFFVRSADWCPYCKRQLVDINSRLAEFEAEGLSVISVSVDEVPLIKQFHEAQDIGYAMLADPEGAINESLGIRDPQYPVG